MTNTEQGPEAETMYEQPSALLVDVERLDGDESAGVGPRLLLTLAAAAERTQPQTIGGLASYFSVVGHILKLLPDGTEVPSSEESVIAEWRDAAQTIGTAWIAAANLLEITLPERLREGERADLDALWLNGEDAWRQLRRIVPPQATADWTEWTSEVSPGVGAQSAEQGYPKDEEQVDGKQGDEHDTEHDYQPDSEKGQ